VLPWLLEGFGTQMRLRFWAQSNVNAFARKRAYDTVFTKGSNHNHEVERKPKGMSATKV